MSTTTVTKALPRRLTRAPRRPGLVAAEFLKLRKRRGLVLSALALTVIPMIIAYTVLLSLNAVDAAKYGPAGGLENFSGSMELLPQLSVVGAILVGATLGAGDLGAGVFRELVVTGRSRLALFAAPVPAGLGFVFPFVGAAFAVTATGSTVFAGTSEAPGASLLVSSAAWLGLVTGLALVLAIGVSSAIGSRGTTIGILLGWQLIVMPLALEIGVLGALREGLVEAAAERLEPARLFEGGAPVPMSLAAAVVVIVAWTIVPLAVGAWRTCTRDA
jgi:hypothetical protein